LVVEVAAACSWLSLLILMQNRGLLTAGSLGALVVVVDVVLAYLATRSAKPRHIEYNAGPRWMTKVQSMKHMAAKPLTSGEWQCFADASSLVVWRLSVEAVAAAEVRIAARVFHLLTLPLDSMPR
jgi:hypothetical protein